MSTLPIPEQVRKQQVEVVKENLDAFASSPTDLGRTSVVVHTIKTGAAKPFRQTMRTIPFARRQYLEQEVEKLLTIGATSQADPGACSFASRTVTTPKKDGSVRMCVNYCDNNAQTEKDAYSYRALIRFGRFCLKLDTSLPSTFSWNITRSRLTRKTGSKRPS